jgi:hypothetical protein
LLMPPSDFFNKTLPTFFKYLMRCGGNAMSEGAALFQPTE